jgi:hypothetical protein
MTSSDAQFFAPGTLEGVCADLTAAIRAAAAHAAECRSTQRRADRSAHAADWLPAATQKEAALEARVRALAAEARAAGTPPERVIALLRQCVTEAPEGFHDPNVREAIWARAFLWALEGYYGPA